MKLDNFKWWIKYNIWNTICNSFNRIKWFYQRGKQGYSEYDLWSLNNYLAEIISKTTKDLATYHCGHPCNVTEKKWNKILLEISEGFNLLQEKTNSVMLTEKEKRKIKKAVRLLHKYWFGLWD